MYQKIQTALTVSRKRCVATPFCLYKGFYPGDSVMIGVRRQTCYHHKS